jgi:hypothetical protein
MPGDKANYPELKITVQGDGTVAAEVPGEEQHDGKIDDNPLLRETLAAFRDWLNQGKLQIERESDLVLLGKLLYQLLFPPTSGVLVKELVFRTLKESRAAKTRMCVQLAFHEAQADLAGLPWEFLYDSASSSFFATNIDLVLTRFVACNGKRMAVGSNEPPLRLLIVVSKPSDLKSVAAEDVIKAIQSFANDNPGRIVLDDPLINRNFLEVQARLEDKDNQPHLMHFIGHGRYNKAKRQGELALLQMDSTQADWVDQIRFKRLFTDSGCNPRLLFLQLCEGAVVEEAELIASFEGLAPTIVSAGIQAVVAMQFPIKNVHAGKISTKFYDELAKGKSVGEAVQAARRMVLTYNPLASGTPVLYMYGYDGPIVSAPAAPPRPSADRTPTNPSGGGPDSPDVARPSAEPPAPTAAPPRPVPNAGSPIARDKLLDAGARKIESMNLEAKEVMSLNHSMYISIGSELEGKSLLEMKQVLAQRCRDESDPELRDVLQEMSAAAERLM